MAVREGTIPTALGAVAASVGAAMAAKRVAPKIAAGIVGFGAAHIILGTVDMVQHKRFWE
jgi:hypothetical protein